MKHRSIAKANEALRLYRQGSDESEMAYKIWCAVHAEMEPDLCKLADAGSAAVIAQNLEPGKVRYTWADIMANGLYDRHVVGSLSTLAKGSATHAAQFD